MIYQCAGCGVQENYVPFPMQVFHYRPDRQVCGEMRTAIANEESAPDPWLLAMVEKRSKELEMARAQYSRALVEAKRAGWPNTVIAKWAGRTEAAIRMYLKRKSG